MNSLRLEGCDREFRMTKFPDIDTSISDRSGRLRIIFEKIFLLVFEGFRFLEPDTKTITERLSIPSLIAREEDDLEAEFSELIESLGNSFDDISMDRKCPIQIEDNRLDVHISNSRNYIDHMCKVLIKEVSI